MDRGQTGSRSAARPGDPFIAIDLPVEQALAELLDSVRSTALPEVTPEDEATILFTSGSTGSRREPFDSSRGDDRHLCLFDRPHRPRLASSTRKGGAASAARTLLSVPLFHVTGEVPVMLNSFVIGRCMVIMTKWDAAEALRLIERERDNLLRWGADDEP